MVSDYITNFTDGGFDFNKGFLLKLIVGVLVILIIVFAVMNLARQKNRTLVYEENDFWKNSWFRNWIKPNDPPGGISTAILPPPPDGSNSFGNHTTQTAIPSGANPQSRFYELSQPGSGGYGLTFNENTRQNVYLDPHADHRRFADTSMGGFSERPSPPFDSTLRRDDRKKKAMRVYAEGSAGGSITQPFSTWYAGWRSMAGNRLPSDRYYHTEGMSSRAGVNSLLEGRGM